MTDCLFCQMASGKIPVNKLYEDDHIFVIKDIAPKAKVHLLVIPKLHIDSLTHTEEAHSALLGRMMVSLQHFAKEQGITAFRTIINTGKEGGQQIFHLHIHVLGGGNLPTF